MFIKEIILEGFKSYPKTTIIKGFDKNFNAITGLNGSGKSNILDAICFVLGITQLNQVRVTTLKELIYKSGVTRIKKATVTIVFDNFNKKESPNGYEKFDELVIAREIIIGGKSKYLINGHTSPASRVHSLFHSVHLNVNNPHFLIMQGKINKVLRMKPMDILGLLEEASGTKMYEIKRNHAIKVMERKQIKLDRIDKVLKEEINPTLNKLSKDKEKLENWNINHRELQKLSKLRIAYKYYRSEMILKEGKNEIQKINLIIKDITVDLKEIKVKMGKINDLIEKAKIKKMNAEGPKVKILNEKEEEILRRIELEKGKLISKEMQLKEYESDVHEIDGKISKIKEKSKIIENKSNETHEKYKKQTQIIEQLKFNMNELKENSIGISNENSKQLTGNISKSIMRSSSIISEFKSMIKKLKLKENYLKNYIKEKESSLKSMNRDDKNFIITLKEKNKILKKLENSRLNKTFTTPQSKESISNSIKDIESLINNLKHQKTNLEISLSKLSINDQRNHPKLLNSKIYGFVAHCIKIKNSKYNIGIEVSAGRRLTNIIVDNQETGKLLLKYGRLKKRLTIIPLDRITSKNIPDNVLEFIKNSFSYKDVKPAVSVIEYEKILRPAIYYIFGKTFICSNMDIAKRVTFNKNIRVRTVTLDGEIFDPSGTLTGGSKIATKNSILHNIYCLKSIDEKIRMKKNELIKLRENYRSVLNATEENRFIESKIELLKHDIINLKGRVENSSYMVLNKKIGESKSELDRVVNEVEDLGEKLKEEEVRIANLTQKTQTNKNKHLEIEQQISTTKQNIHDKNENLVNLAQLLDIDKLSIQKIAEEINRHNIKKSSIKKEMMMITNSIRIINQSINLLNKERKECLQNKDKLCGKMKKYAKIIDKNTIKDTFLRHEEAIIKNKIDYYENEISKLNRLEEKAVETIKKLEDENKWIEKDKHLFGTTGSVYNFKDIKPDKLKDMIDKLRIEQNSLNTQVNQKALILYDRKKFDYNNLIKKRKIVLNDKKELNKAINKLDKEKNEVLETIYSHVNKEFDSIYRCLLPGSNAKLTKIDSKTVLKGLEINVAFNNNWKSSLSELSGGQRSLLALSLILSLLIIKPAPMYILDEIDAALDTFHTRNIGLMLATHFAKSQFIIVSLKEGMYNNANVIYKTVFMDGVSTVTRINSLKHKKNKKFIKK